MFTHRFISRHIEVLSWFQQGQLNTKVHQHNRHYMLYYFHWSTCLYSGKENVWPWICMRMWLDACSNTHSLTHTHTHTHTHTLNSSTYNQHIVFHSHHLLLTNRTVTFKWNYCSICIFVLSLRPPVELRLSLRVLKAVRVPGIFLINSLNEKWPPVDHNCRKWECASWLVKHTDICFIMLWRFSGAVW